LWIIVGQSASSSPKLYLIEKTIGEGSLKYKLAFTCLIFTVCLLAVSNFAHGQGTDLSTVRGTVTDSSGAVVPKALVSIVDLETNTSRRTATNAQGEYELFGVKSGRYKVTVSAAGLSTAEINNVVVNGSSIVGVNATLHVSSSSEVVQISAEAAGIDTEDQTISDTIGSRAIVDLPRDSRDVYSFLYLNPNITQADASGSGTFKFIGSQSYGASISLDGQRSNGGIFGTATASAPSLEAVDELSVLSNDFSAEYAGVANIRVTTKRGGDKFHGSLFYDNKNSALAAWSLQDKFGQANFVPNSFQSKFPAPFFNINDLGAAVGGRIPHVKNTWFFAAFERNWTVQPTEIQSSSLPHPSLWTGDFSMVNDAAKPDVPNSVLAMLTPQEVANDTITDANGNVKFITIPSRLLNPTVQKLIATYFPPIGLAAPITAKNGRIPNFQTLVPGRSTQDLGTLRVDHDFTEKNHLYVTYHASDQAIAQNPVVSPYTGLGLTHTDRLNNTVGISYTRIFSSSFVNEARGGFNKESLFRHSNTTLQGFLSSIGFDSSDIAAYGAAVGPAELTTFGHTAINFNGAFATFTNGGRNTNRPMDQNLATFGDTLTWIHGRHNFKMGGDLVRNAATDGFALNRGNPRGLVTYRATPTTSGNGKSGATDPFANFLLGLPASSATYVSQPRPPMIVHNWEHGYFFQDDWKVTPRLTLNLGLRYELITPFVEKNDLLVNFDPNFTNPNTGQPGIFIVPSDATLKYISPTIINFGVITAAKVSLGRGLLNADKDNFAPRIGMAWRVGDKSVVRAGYGIYYPTSAAQGIRDPIGTNGFNQGVTARNRASGPLEGWPGFQHGISPVTGGVLGGFGNQPSANAVPFDLQQPMIHQYNVTYEREIGWSNTLRVSYLGTYMHGLITGVDLNEIPPNDIPFGTTDGSDSNPPVFCSPSDGTCALSSADLARYKFPLIGENLNSFGNQGHGLSNAFQTQLEHRYAKGLLFSVSYTLLDQKSTIGDTTNSSLGSLAYNPFQPNSDYTEDSFVSRHRVVGYVVYQLPVGQGQKYGNSMPALADWIIGGWQVSSNFFAKSGTRFTPYWLCDNCDPAFPGNIASSSVDAVGDFNNTSFRPNIMSSNFNQRIGDAIWNINAFGPPSVGADVFSNPAVAKRNSLTGPGTWGVNLGVHKNFHFGERVTAELGADIDNVFNHPMLSPDFNYGGGGGPFAQVGDFNINVDQTTGKILPIAAADITTNPSFGRVINSFAQEGIDNKRTVRLRLRVTF
jgi:hypothetical protein